ncbi:MAG: hypothetical protein OHK0039_35550 [Bacteroidia bacterium]
MITLPGVGAWGQSAPAADARLVLVPGQGRIFVGEPLRASLRLYLPEADGLVIDPAALRDLHERLALAWGRQETLSLAWPRRIYPPETTREAVFELYGSFLIPVQEGTLLLPAETFVFGRRAGRDTALVAVRAQAATIEVQPLPPTTLPRAATPGRFSLEAVLPRQRYQTGAGIDLELLLRGSGNLSFFPSPALHLPTAFLAEDPRPHIFWDKGDSLLGGEKVFSYRLTAALPGDYDLGPVWAYYFDPAAARYDTLHIASIPLHIYGDPLPQLLGGEAIDDFYRQALTRADTTPRRLRHWPLWLLPLCLATLLAALAWRLWR